MSGPKVVRIKTREEFMSDARSQLRAVDVARARCERIGRRHDAWSDEQSRKLDIRRAQLQGYLNHDQWGVLAQASAAELAFIAAETARIEEAATAVAERAVVRRQRLAGTARSLVRMFQAKGGAAPPELETVQAKALAADDRELVGFESMVNGHIREWTARTQPTPSDEAQGLAARLRGDEPAVGVGDLVEADRLKEVSEHETHTARLLAELATIVPEFAPIYQARLATATAQPTRSQRALLMDSLVFDLAGEMKRQRAFRTLVSMAEETIAALEDAPDGESAEMKRAIAKTLARGVGASADAELRVILDAADRLLDSRARQAAAAARRAAVLTALSSLGYEVREGMETALASAGRVVVRKASVPDYGVEVASVADTPRFQVRVVGSQSAQRTAARDRDAESVWCGEVDVLRASLESHGAELEIERAAAVGEVAVKSVDFGVTVTPLEVGQERPRERRLPGS